MRNYVIQWNLRTSTCATSGKQATNSTGTGSGKNDLSLWSVKVISGHVHAELTLDMLLKIISGFLISII